MSQYVPSDDGCKAFEKAFAEASAHSHDTSVFRLGNESNLELVARVTPVPMRRVNAQTLSSAGSRIDIFDRTRNGSCLKETTLKYFQKLTGSFSQRSGELLLRLIYYESNPELFLIGWVFIIASPPNDTTPRLTHNLQLNTETVHNFLATCIGLHYPVLWTLNILVNILSNPLRDLYRYSRSTTVWTYWVWLAIFAADPSVATLSIGIQTLTNSCNWCYERHTLVAAGSFGAWLLGIVGLYFPVQILVDLVRAESAKKEGCIK